MTEKQKDAAQKLASMRRAIDDLFDENGDRIDEKYLEFGAEEADTLDGAISLLLGPTSTKMDVGGAYAALASLVNTVESTGGVMQNRKGHLLPKADPEWIDLGDAYKEACEALGRKMMVEPDLEDAEEGADG